MHENYLKNENSPRKSKNGDFSVNWEIIQSEEFKIRISKISNNEKVVNSIITRCKWILNNRDGLKSEEMVAISSLDGEEIGRITNQNIEFGIKRDSKFTKQINKAERKGIKYLLIHNHPRGFPPSISDINALLNSKNASGITIGHNGSIYFYTSPKKKIDILDFDIATKKFSMYTEITRIEKALEVLSHKYSFIFKKL